MAITVIQKSFAHFKKFLPPYLWNPIRSAGTAVIGPSLFAYRTGYWRSAFKRAAVSRKNQPLPWYTYPAIDFLKYRNYEGKSVLEFGGGQSTLWWAERADKVVTFEGDQQWFLQLKGKIPQNVELSYVSMESREKNIEGVRNLMLESQGKYDVIVIDGLYRCDMIKFATACLKDDGIIICDDSEGFGFYEGFKDSGLSRVDFFGNAPGVVLPHCTSIYYNSASFVFKPDWPIPLIVKEP